MGELFFGKVYESFEAKEHLLCGTFYKRLRSPAWRWR